jgi:hypothetical protein
VIFATIVTESHAGYARTLAESLQQSASEAIVLHCLIVDGKQLDARAGAENHLPIRFYHLEDLQNLDDFRPTVEKYEKLSQDSLRWALKPLFVKYLLQEHGTGPIAYLDADQFFVGDPRVLFDLEPTTRMMLSPHWRSIRPEAGQVFHDLFTDGIFNGGLFIATVDAVPILSWWAAACLYRCEKSPGAGLWDDQKYLDILPVYFDGVHWLRYKGVNVAGWNRETLHRACDAEQGVLVEGDPLVCVHFSPSTIRIIDNGEDPCLKPLLAKYRERLTFHGALPSTLEDRPNLSETSSTGSTPPWWKRLLPRWVGK